ncbi:hypothetical protein PHYBLDRAFT_61830 [Phycomyces blakesleeanus NRRL 1555(-)]|uniref:Uncharacterized protein n=1 Tax=Phycomyces blakesleeanus (strain ATCC 8743b / DSM 1359 / FGSC 10004 / NBRC 33097 / NRRL 1555) TaxID=763407 RepID=A0A167R3R0_PHYB8|nr:hypothetical protein PHYBLDRAFT_61830 [Phycomyces blakesleeanus NRRL 1555(-)]OAD80777.1 hypothetical protein PHYBLDRAFT_61830 [Phycomyces blakesleeanus NRRL 1555(-)]|eukprot:XP_018298817.1 hypothetical protein PHYBLDRAFT_61830 [Phycomyces blakesleeanus NRRL 1555(-)]
MLNRVKTNIYPRYSLIGERLPGEHIEPGRLYKPENKEADMSLSQSSFKRTTVCLQGRFCAPDVAQRRRRRSKFDRLFERSNFDQILIEKQSLSASADELIKDILEVIKKEVNIKLEQMAAVKELEQTLKANKYIHKYTVKARYSDMDGGQKFYHYHYIERVFFLLRALFSDISNAAGPDIIVRFWITSHVYVI